MIKIRPGRGLLRLYLAVWLMSALVFFLSSPRELLTSAGVSYWTKEQVESRLSAEFENEYKTLRCKELGDGEGNRSKEFRGFTECEALEIKMGSSDPNSFVEQDYADSIGKAFIIGMVLLPLIALFLGYLCFQLLTWVFRGFRP